MKQVLTAAAIVLAMAGSAVAKCEDVYLTDADKKVLEDVKKIEKKGGAVKGIIAWSPVVLVTTSGKALEAGFTASTTDFSLHAQAIQGMGKLVAYKAYEALYLHSIDIPGDDPDGCRQEFFELLAEKYNALL